MHLDCLSLDRLLAIALAAASIDFVVRVEQFGIGAKFIDADSVIVANQRRKVADRDAAALPVGRISIVRNHAVFDIVTVNPLKALCIAVSFVQSGVVGIESVKISNQVLHAKMFWLFQ